MTEYEIEDLKASNISALASSQNNHASHTNIYLTLVFGFFAVAYVTGNSLTVFQVTVITIIYLAAACMQIYWMAVWIDTSIRLLTKLAELGESITPPKRGSIGRIVGLFLWFIGALAPLAFLWSIRHP
jgi:hypothetical protein